MKSTITLWCFGIILSIIVSIPALGGDFNVDYIIFDSNSRLISINELSNLNPWELKVARNEIYARHGRKFQSGDLRCYFENKNWYSVNPGYSDGLLNNYEKKNAILILNYEKQRGSKLTYKDMGCGYSGDRVIKFTKGHKTDSDYVIEDSNKRTVSVKELLSLSPWDLKVARNEIYARHGRKFQSRDLSCHFENKYWYSINNNYSDSLLNNYEKNNAITILKYEQSVKSPVIYKDMGCGYPRY